MQYQQWEPRGSITGLIEMSKTHFYGRAAAELSFSVGVFVHFYEGSRGRCARYTRARAPASRTRPRNIRMVSLNLAQARELVFSHAYLVTPLESPR